MPKARRRRTDGKAHQEADGVCAHTPLVRSDVESGEGIVSLTRGVWDFHDEPGGHHRVGG